MINKILVFGGMALAAILIIENLVIQNTAYFFIDNNSSAGFVVFASTIIGIGIGIGISGIYRESGKSKLDDDNIDF